MRLMAQTLTKLRVLALVTVALPWCLSVSTSGDVGHKDLMATLSI
jgi:hypothetical protein